MGKFWRSGILVLVAAAVALWFIWAAFYWAPTLLPSSAGTPEPSTVAQVLTGTLLTAAGFIVLILVEPLKATLGDAVTDVVGVFAMPACRIFIFGYPATGKTSLIRRLVALRQDGNEPSTVGFHVYQMRAPLDLEKNRSIKVLFADYEGGATQNLFVNPPAYFAFAGRRHVNVLVFFVDMLKEWPVSDPDATKRAEFRQALIAAMDQRISVEMERYITPESIKLAFKISGHGEKLCAVRLLINKADILRAHQSALMCDDVATFAKQKLARTIGEISTQCEKLGISDKFKICLVSARTREGVDEFITDVIDLYQRHKGIPGVKDVR